MEDTAPETAVINVKLADEAEQLPLPYANTLYVQSGGDDFFVTLAAVVPPEITSLEDAKRYPELVAKPLFRFAASRLVIKNFITILQQHYENQLAAAEQGGY